MASGRFTWGMVAVAILALLTFVAMAVASENSPPRVELETPPEGARLGVSVVVSGTATDDEGFNMSSLVQMRWNDWEWFEVPSTPAQAGMALYFGETVNLQWHAPGEHTVAVRAFDGELWSREASVNVTVRDLPDLVILPTSITLDPEDARGGDEAHVMVAVHNQGGEDVEDVQVVLSIEGREVATETVDLVPAYRTVEVRFPLDLEEGNLTLRATAEARGGSAQEKSEANNDAERTFNIPEGEDDALNAIAGMVFLVIIIVLFVTLVALGLRGDEDASSRKP